MLRIRDLHYRIGDRVLLDGASAHVPVGHKVGLVGRNGSGKSTLLRLIAGEIPCDAGAIALRRGARLGMVAQEAPAGETPLLDLVLSADLERARLLAEAEGERDAHRIAELHERLEAVGAHAAPARAAAILAGLGFDAEDQGRPTASFSGGRRMRAALAAVLFSQPDLLLLDEPTNYLDLEGTLWLEKFLEDYPKTLLVVSHDRELLNKAVDAILHLDDGKLALYPGGYDDFERLRREKLSLQEKARRKQEAERARIQAFVDRFRAKATKAKQAQSRLKALARMEPIAAVAEERTVPFRFPTPGAVAPPLATLDRVSVGYAPGRPVLRDLSLRLDMDDRIALLGPNGNGKSTFSKLLAGRLAPQGGRLDFSPKARVGYFAQHQLDELFPAESPFRHLAARMPGAAEHEIRARLGAFGFGIEKADVPAEKLSGGEKARLLFALMSLDAPHLMILDEPTNHLDVDSREALVRALAEYEGAVLLVSHDRHLLEASADRLWLVAEGTVRPFEGDLDDYARLVLESRREAARGEARAPRPSARDERRAAAEARERAAPLRKAAREAEEALERLQAEKARTEAALADPAVYAGPKDALAALSRRRAELEREIALAEERWLQAHEALENP